MQVTKRDGGIVDFSVEKIHVSTQRATKGLTGVSFSDIEMNANLSLYDKIPTSEIQQILIKSANDLISTSHPNYQYAAARLLNMELRKQVWGSNKAPNFTQFIQNNVDNGIYDPAVFNKWDYPSVDELGKYMNHNRDDSFTSAGLQQLVDKYLVKNRDTGKI